MRVKLLCNLGSNDFPGFPFMDGEVHEVTEQLGAKLLAQQLAVDVTPPPKTPEPQAAAEVIETKPPEPKATEPPAKHKSHK